MDELIVAMALDGVTALNLGKGPTTDLLAISLSATDAVSHRLGPASKEAHDQVLRDDKTIGVFLDSLFKMRDPAKIIVVLSADHGFTPIPELAPADANPRPTRASLAPALAEARKRLADAKMDTAAIDVDQQIVLMDRSKFQGQRISAESILDTFEKAAKGLPGIKRVDRFANLARDTATDPVARRWSHQFPAGTNVELVATLTPGSLWGNFLVASHGSPYDYDSNVPDFLWSGNSSFSSKRVHPYCRYRSYSCCTSRRETFRETRWGGVVFEIDMEVRISTELRSTGAFTEKTR